MHVNRATIDPHERAAPRWINVVVTANSVQPVTFANVRCGRGGMLRFDEDLRCSRNERKGNLFILHLVRGRIREKARRGVWRGDFVSNEREKD